MTYSRNTAVVALCGLLVGALASIGTAQYAQVVAFSGANPNAMQQERGITKKAPSCVNPRSIMQNLFSGFSKQRPCPVVKEEAEDVLHGAPTLIEPLNEDCAQTENARRRAACNAGLRLTNETNR
ncbi:hypothetical protein AUJ46_04090 [Candidatus Peregrinibacteria bacterium CG1_02_54_53]|nr:MAG: hypothetical protein AUJ46_04090 [Candidatus Peregrinibacteria bacterium CG1_02_54_53]